MAHALEKTRRARPKPILPPVNVTVLHRIMVDVIDAGPVMTMRLDNPVKAVEPDLSSSLIVFAVPIVGRASVQESNLVAQCFDAFGSDEYVVVIRQNAPGVDAGRKLFTGAQQISFKVAHSFVTHADMMFVFEAGSGDEELPLPKKIQVRR